MKKGDLIIKLEMVTIEKPIPRKDLKTVLRKNYGWRAYFHNYTACKNDYGTWATYEIHGKINALGNIVLAVLFIPATLFYFITNSAKLIREIVKDLASEFNDTENWQSIDVKRYFEDGAD